MWCHISISINEPFQLCYPDKNNTISFYYICCTCIISEFPFSCWLQRTGPFTLRFLFTQNTSLMTYQPKKGNYCPQEDITKPVPQTQIKKCHRNTTSCIRRRQSQKELAENNMRKSNRILVKGQHYGFSSHITSIYNTIKQPFYLQLLKKMCISNMTWQIKYLTS